LGDRPRAGIPTLHRRPRLWWSPGCEGRALSEMATKKLRRTPKRMTSKKRSVNKSDFIRKLPATLSSREIVAKAKAAGIKFDERYVYRIRALARSKRKGGAKPGLARTAAPNVASVSAAPKPTTTKAAFVRSLPSTIPAKAVVAQAKAAGMKLSTTYVYIVRAAAKENRGLVRAGRSVPRPIATTSSTESLLKALGAEMGLAKAIEILSGERARVRAVIRG
jgi:hypothetical protein